MKKNLKDPLNFSFENVLEIAKLIMPVAAPFVQGALWFGFTKLDKRAAALNNLIALAEIIPAVDLNLPKGVVLAALYDKTEDAVKIINDLIQGLKEIPNTVKKQVEKIKDDIEEKIEEVVPDIPQVDTYKLAMAVKECNDNAKKELGWLYNSLTAPPWIASCMLQKGMPVTTKWIKDKLGL